MRETTLGGGTMTGAERRGEPSRGDRREDEVGGSTGDERVDSVALDRAIGRRRSGDQSRSDGGDERQDQDDEAPSLGFRDKEFSKLKILAIHKPKTKSFLYSSIDHPPGCGCSHQINPNLFGARALAIQQAIVSESCH